MRRNNIRLYNVLFPIWMLIWYPSWLWLILIPLNYLVDRAVTAYSFRRSGVDGYHQKARQHAWKTCVIGFLSDFVGSSVLLLPLLLSGKSVWLNQHIGDVLPANPFADPFALLYSLIAIVITGIMIYYLNRWMLRKDKSLSEQQVCRTARNLALITAPYFFLIPSILLYR